MSSELLYDAPASSSLSLTRQPLPEEKEMRPASAPSVEKASEIFLRVTVLSLAHWWGKTGSAHTLP